MEISQRIRSTSEDLTELEGKQIELKKKRKQLNNHKQVFLAELERINNELDDVNTSLDDIKVQYNTAWWRQAHLRALYICQILFQCLCYIGTLLAFLSINILSVAYYLLAGTAYLLRTVLDSQIKTMSGKMMKNDLDDSLSWS